MMYLTEVVICGIAVVFSLVGGGTAQNENEKHIAEFMLSPSTRHMQYGEYDEEPEKNVLLYLYTRSSGDTPRQLVLNNISSLIESDFDTARKTLVVIHGYKNNVNSSSVQDVKNGALEFHDVNVIAVDWDYYTRRVDYGFAVINSQPVGNYLGKFIEWLMAHGLSRTDLHIIGHSLGAHVAGFAGKRLQAHGHPAARITGLDPALPGFYNLDDAKNRLNATDAVYVDCIHTCGGILGIPSPICQADFFPNRGQNIQPGCSIFDLGTCSHKRAFQFFAESFNSKHSFNAETCKGYDLWVPNNCQDEGALMGYPAGAGRYTGLFSLTTNSRYPFAKNVTATNW